MHVFKSGTQNVDDAPDYYSREWIARAAFGRGNPEGDFVGRVIGINGDEDGIAFHHLPEDNLPTDVRVEEATAPPSPTKRFLTAEEEAEREFLEAWIAEQDAA